MIISAAASPTGIIGRGRDRSLLLNQVLLGSVVLLAAILVVIFDAVADGVLLILGVTAVFVATGAAFVLPWNRFPALAMLVLPLADIGAIVLMRSAAPDAALGLMWAFPAIWIASAFGGWGALLGSGLITIAYWAQNLADPAQTINPGTFLFPVMIGGLATIAAIGSRRAIAQRTLLDKQSLFLQRSVDRARRQEDLVTEVLQAVDFGVIRLTPDGSMVVTNEAHGRLQRARAETSRAYAADGISPLDDEDLPLARARRGEVFENTLVWHGDPGDENRRALRSTARRLVDKDLSDAGMVIVTLDATAEELALRARADLIASVSHELRTPLTSITGYVELALDDPSLSPVSRRSLEVVERNAGRLLDIVADLLTASAASHQGVELTLRTVPTDLSTVVEAAVEAALPRAQERRVQIDTSAVESVWAIADPHRMRQVVDNLLSNAIKYNHVGGRVEVGLTGDASHVWLAVSDNGPGIAESELPRLFERFFRSGLVRNSTTHGSGLGLAISREIVRAHGGDITVRTVLHEGAMFIVRLPALSSREGTRS
ncbi:sensor histidine kinase [Microbacterium sp. TNHR37B]|uniref:sensor histidine kinase n=1 Tax=Microbacterium sp. TNHR37B TaxID=1775956 RepID=UPI0007B236FB|nr:HAMP domain-containing sensor histidine kinase [Microbacterium sp. TNHR37B]KZE90718.1 Alkaline phosphatase synthesis sensor protein PhoR [Microbacterium sp. TNHR37B]